MYADIAERIERIQAKIDDVNHQMIEAEGAKLFKLEDKLERLEDELQELLTMQDDMELTGGNEE